MKNENWLEHRIPSDLISFFREQAIQKIEIEGWAKQGRNVKIKIENFVNCWVTEEAFKQLLISKKVWFRNRGLYFGDSQGAGADFTTKINENELTIGLRSVSVDSLYKWKSVAYPDDRFREEQDKIADYIIVCHNQEGLVKFYGIIPRDKLLIEMQNAKRLYSKINQEYFRTIDLNLFSYQEMVNLIERMDAI